MVSDPQDTIEYPAPESCGYPQETQDPIFQSLNFGSPHFKYFIPPKSITTLWRFRERSERPGFSSFLVTFFFSLHKEKKKVTERFEIKEEL